MPELALLLNLPLLNDFLYRGGDGIQKIDTNTNTDNLQGNVTLISTEVYQRSRFDTFGQDPRHEIETELTYCCQLPEDHTPTLTSQELSFLFNYFRLKSPSLQQETSFITSLSAFLALESDGE